MQRVLLYLLVLSILIPGMISCKKNRFNVNISSVRADIEVKRLETDLFGTDPDKIPSMVPELKKNYGSFLQLFSYVINTGNVNDSSFADFLIRFCTDKLNNEVYSEIMKEYQDIRPLQKNLENAFRHYMFYFPEATIPRIYTCMTGFNRSIIIGDSALGISLDRYLGRNCEYYPRLQIYRYLSDRMNSYDIVPDCLYAWGLTEWPYDSVGYSADNVISEIVHEGKLKYFERCMLPEADDSILFGFNASQMKFCRNNEKQMWEYMIKNDLLFSTDQMVIRKFTGDAPFTSYFTNESPGRAAVWIGFRIIESYMMRNSNTDLGKLMTNPDFQGILSAAKYNPK